MASPSEKLAKSLEILEALQKRGTVAIRSAHLARTHRERLLANGFLKEVMKGWYFPIPPDEPAGDSSAWYASFWGFCSAYLRERFGTAWCISPEQSLLLHTGVRAVPQQLLVRASRAGNKVTVLPFETSLLDVRAALPDEVVEVDGMRLFGVAAALVACSPLFFRHHPNEAKAALAMIRDASELLPSLLEGGHTTIAGRLSGALRNIGQERLADELVAAMRAAGHVVREADPFDKDAGASWSVRDVSPYVNRMHLMWQAMRASVLERFPPAPGLPVDGREYLAHVEDSYVSDAYHSLSIEGYRVSAELIERVRSGRWNPDGDDMDRKHRDALAARGYWQAHRAVRESLERVLKGDAAGPVAREDHGKWYRAMFAPSVMAGLVRAAQLAGYRNDQVFIRRSMHVPPRREAVRDMMPTLFALLSAEEEPSIRVVLGHFFFVYIHPYMDGNGRIGRFLMNVMLASGGYPWTVVPLRERTGYMAALEEASVRQNIVPFVDFLATLVEASLQGDTAPVPGA